MACANGTGNLRKRKMGWTDTFSAVRSTGSVTYKIETTR